MGQDLGLSFKTSVVKGLRSVVRGLGSSNSVTKHCHWIGFQASDVSALGLRPTIQDLSKLAEFARES